MIREEFITEGHEMSVFSLVIGNKNASSWSLRPWLLMMQAELEFDEIPVRIREADTKERILRHSPAGKVPALLYGDQVIWDSLAICEYIADLYPEKKFWPEDIQARAHARSISAEMHAGFTAVRKAMPMACLSTFDCPALEGDLNIEVERIKDIWRDCVEKYEGPYLFGAFTIADVMYAPIVSRFTTYQVPLDAGLKSYCETILSMPAMQKWFAECDPNDLLL